MTRSLLLATAALGFLITAPVQAESLSGSYLSANHANLENDYKAASFYFNRALERDPDDVYLLQNAMLAAIGKGDMDMGVSIAQKLEDNGAGAQLSDMLRLAAMINAQEFDSAARILTRTEGVLNELLSGLIEGWVEFGRGNYDNAIAKFETLGEPATLRLFGQYHKALAQAAVGDFEGADVTMRGEDGNDLRINRGAVIAHAQILDQIGKQDEALEILDAALVGSQDQEVTALRAAIAQEGSVAYDFITSAKEGAGEVFFTLATALQAEQSDYSALLYSRLTTFMRPNDTSAILLTADILRDQSQFDLAADMYTRVAQDDPMFLNAEIGRADTLLEAEQPKAAIEVLRGLTRSHAEVPQVYMTLGDALRGEEEYEDARNAYRQAAALIPDPAPNHWFLYYALGITSERLDEWEQAETDFRRALELSPNQPLVLNYLGYSLVEKGLKLDEAQGMIEKAVEARPNSGYITDSLGWVFYRLGKFEEAVAPMERAVELLPDDPIINDHLGDVYWKVGRKREAMFQWKRALSFEPEDKEAERIRRKLDVGLDEVLEAEEQLAASSNEN